MSRESESRDPNPSQPRAERQTSLKRTSDKEIQPRGNGEEELASHCRVNCEESTAPKMENPRKRKHSSKDSGKVGRGNEEASPSEKRQKTTAKEAKPKASGHPELACPEVQHTGPPPLRKSLVLFLRDTSEAVYRDIVQLQAQQQHFPLPQEKLSQLTEVSGSLTAMIQTFYSMATQAAYAFPAQGWLVPPQVSHPERPAGSESQSSSVDAGEKITHLDSPSDKSSH